MMQTYRHDQMHYRYQKRLRALKFEGASQLHLLVDRLRKLISVCCKIIM